MVHGVEGGRGWGEVVGREGEVVVAVKKDSTRRSEQVDTDVRFISSGASVPTNGVQ